MVDAHGEAWQDTVAPEGPAAELYLGCFSQLTMFSGRETLQPFRMLHPPKKNEREIRPPKKGTHISIGKCILKTIIFSGDIMLVFRGGKRKRFFLVAGKQFWKESPFFLRFSATNGTNWEVFAFGCLAMVWNHQVYPSVLFAGRRACQG